MITFLDIEIVFNVVQYDELLQLCDCVDFKEAFDLVKKLMQQNPTHSELLRIKGQLESELGLIDEVVHSLRSAPKC